MKKVSKQFLLSMVAMLSISLGVLFTGCSDDDDSGSIKMTTDNVVGTWKNVDKNLTLVISATGTGTYTSDYYSNPSESITWEVSGEKYLDIQGTGLFSQTYKLKSKDKLEDIFLGNVLTKQ